MATETEGERKPPHIAALMAAVVLSAFVLMMAAAGIAQTAAAKRGDRAQTLSGAWCSGRRHRLPAGLRWRCALWAFATLTACTSTRSRRAVSTSFDGRGAAPFRFAVQLLMPTPAAPHIHPAIDGKMKRAGTIGREIDMKSTRIAGAQTFTECRFLPKGSRLQTSQWHY